MSFKVVRDSTIFSLVAPRSAVEVTDLVKNYPLAFGNSKLILLEYLFSLRCSRGDELFTNFTGLHIKREPCC